MVDATTTNSIVQQTAPDRWQVSSGSVSFHGTTEQMAVHLAFMMQEVSRLRSTIESFGNGGDFDWNVLTEIERLRLLTTLAR